MRRLRSFFLWSVALALAALVAVAVWLHTPHASGLVAARLAGALGRPVRLGSLGLGFPSDLHLEHLQVGFRDGGFPAGTLARVDRVAVRIEPLSSLVAMRPVLGVVRLDSGELGLRRDARGQVNLADLYEEATGGEEGPPGTGGPATAAEPRLPVLLRSLEVREVRVHLVDRALSPPLAAEVDLVRLDATPESVTRGRVSLEAELRERPLGDDHPLGRSVGASLSVEASYQLGASVQGRVGLRSDDLAGLAYHLERAGGGLPVALEALPLELEATLAYSSVDGVPRFVVDRATADPTGATLAWGPFRGVLEGEVTMQGDRTATGPGFRLGLGEHGAVGLEVTATGLLRGDVILDARAEARDLPAAALVEAAGGILPAGSAARGHVDVDLAVARTPDSLEVSGEVTPEGLVLETPALGAPVEVLGGGLRVEPRRARLELPFRVGAVRGAVEGDLAPATRDGALDLRLEVEPVGVEALVALLPPERRGALEGAPASGRVEVGARVGGTLAAPTLEARVVPRDLAVRPPNLPEVRVRGSGVVVDRERARADLELEAGAVGATLAAELTPPARDGHLTVELRARGVELATLAGGVPALGEALADPVGTLDVEAFLGGPVPGGPGEVLGALAARVEGRGLAASVGDAGTRVAVDRLGAVWKAGALTLERAAVRALNRSAELRGRVEGTGLPVTLDLEVELPEVGAVRVRGQASPATLDLRLSGAGLKAAGLPALAGVPAPAGVAGTFSLEGSYQGAPAGGSEALAPLDLSVRPSGLAVALELLGQRLRFDLVAERLRLRGGRLPLDGVGVATPLGKVDLAGWWAPLEAPRGVVEAKARGLDLTALLPEGSSAGGGLDADVKVTLDPDDPELDLRLTPRDVTLRFGGLAWPLRWKGGRVTGTQKALRLEDLALSLSERSLLLVTGRLLDPLGERRFSEARAVGALELADLQPAFGLDPSRTFTGEVEVEASLEGTAAAFVVEGRARADSGVALEYRSSQDAPPFVVPAEAVSASFRMEGDELAVTPVRATVYDGTLTGSGLLDLSRVPFAYVTRAELGGASFEAFSRRSLHLPGGVRGKLYLALEGSGRGADVEAFEARGPGSVEGMVLDGRALADHFGVTRYLTGEEGALASPAPKRRRGLGGLLDSFVDNLEETLKEKAADLARKEIPGAGAYAQALLKEHRYPAVDLTLRASGPWMGVERFEVRRSPGTFEGKAMFHRETLALDAVLQRARFEVAGERQVLVRDLRVKGSAAAPRVDPLEVLKSLSVVGP